jgi:hypothetical protein
MKIQKHEPQPLPLHIADRWNFQLTYYEKDGQYLYSVNDWFLGLGAKDPKDSFKKYRSKGGELKVTPLPIQTAGGEQVANFTNDEGLYLIAQDMRSTKTRPQLKEIKEYLAKAGVFVDQLRQTSQSQLTRQEKMWDKLGKSESWKVARRDGTVSRKRFTSMLQDVIHEMSGMQYGQATNAVYRGLFDRKAGDLKQQAGVKQIRDHMPTAGLSYVQLVEDYVISSLAGRADVPFDEALALIDEITTDLKPIIMKHQRAKGIDLGTGRPLLGDKSG